MATREELLAAARPIVTHLAGLDPAEPAHAERALAGLDTTRFVAQLRAAHAEGWITPRESGGVRYGRLTRAAPESDGFSVDVVDMSGAANGAHTHPRGEFDLCVPIEGSPAFDGRRGPWVVYPPGSRHVPTVTGGRMLVVYFLPDGEIRFEGG